MIGPGVVRVLALVVLSALGCAPKPTVAPEAAPAVETEAAPDATTPTDGGPTEVLSREHDAPVRIEGSVTVSRGYVVAYRYDRLEAEVGALTADGIDVGEDLAAAARDCEALRAGLDADDRMWVEDEEGTCEAVAARELFDDEQLLPGCEAVGVAYFDAQGVLLDRIEVQGACLAHVDAFALQDLSPRAEPDVVLQARFSWMGALTRGGWGTTEERTLWLALAPKDLDGEPALWTLASLVLDDWFDGGNCNHGHERRVRVAKDGALERFGREWDECADECIDPAMVDPDADDIDPDMLCHEVTIEAERAEWSEEDEAWDALDPIDYEGTELPDA